MGAANELTVDEYADYNDVLLARQSVSRRSLLKGAFVGAGAVALSQMPIARAAFAAAGGTAGPNGLIISGRHLAWASDTAGDPTTAMRATAQLISPTGTLAKTLKAYVDVGTAPGVYGTHIAANVVHLVGLYAIPHGPVSSQYYIKATISGLHPATIYHYRFRLSDGTVTGDAFFSTAPARTLLGTASANLNPFTFTAFADTGTDLPATDPKFAWGADPASVKAANGVWPRGSFDNHFYSAGDPIAGSNGTDKTPATTQTLAIAAQAPAFALLAGDICYADPTGSGLPVDDVNSPKSAPPSGKNAYNPYVWDAFLNQIDAAAAFTPWMFATGNHDMEALYSKPAEQGDSPTHGYAGHVMRLDLPKSGPASCPSVYSFVYGNVGVISLDANELSAEIRANTGYSKGAQLAFLESTLKQWRTNAAIAKTVDFVVAFFHHCAYATGSTHGSDGGVRTALDKLFSTYQVDLAIQGHNHQYERTDPIRFGQSTVSAPDGSTISPATDGVSYLCVGSGGRAHGTFLAAPGSSAPAAPGSSATGAQALVEGQRYRGYKPAGGLNVKENNTNRVVNAFQVTTASGKVPEAIDWSQARYTGYAYVAFDVVPAPLGGTTTLTIRTLADRLPGTTAPSTEIDRVTLLRTAGNGFVTLPA